jgi:hypothetical protein
MAIFDRNILNHLQLGGGRKVFYHGALCAFDIQA